MVFGSCFSTLGRSEYLDSCEPKTTKKSVWSHRVKVRKSGQLNAHKAVLRVSLSSKFFVHVIWNALTTFRYCLVIELDFLSSEI